MKDLETTYPKVFAYIESVQPYNIGYEWLGHLTKFSNERHIKLTPQKESEQSTLTIEHGDVSMTLGENASFIIGDGNISMNGKSIRGNQSIDINSTKIFGDPVLKAKKERWVSFCLADTDIDAINLCKIAITEGRRIKPRFSNYSSLIPIFQ